MSGPLFGHAAARCFSRGQPPVSRPTERGDAPTRPKLKVNDNSQHREHPREDREASQDVKAQRTARTTDRPLSPEKLLPPDRLGRSEQRPRLRRSARIPGPGPVPMLLHADPTTSTHLHRSQMRMITSPYLQKHTLLLCRGAVELKAAAPAATARMVF